ncbi:hypothetical protein [Halomicrobium salinisoli]|uniref:DUF7860 family protein n=1 Tax=Halomicrobium salinisoli TaxID=2878391 RepID=UPI001CF04272|nr:hypothetical protein [Halomicrobium salinisoli]
MSHTRDIDYPTTAKRLVALGIGLFLFGALGSAVGHAVFGSLPAWEETLLFDAEVLGIVIGMIGAFGFGIILPLTE